MPHPATCLVQSIRKTGFGAGRRDPSPRRRLSRRRLHTRSAQAWPKPNADTTGSTGTIRQRPTAPANSRPISTATSNRRIATARYAISQAIPLQRRPHRDPHPVPIPCQGAARASKDGTVSGKDRLRARLKTRCSMCSVPLRTRSSSCSTPAAWRRQAGYERWRVARGGT